MNRAIQIGLFAVTVFVGTSGVSLWQADHRAPLISRAQFLSQIEVGHVTYVGIDGRIAYLTDATGGFSRVVVPDDSSGLISDLQRHGVKVGIHLPPNRNLLTWLTRVESRLRFGA